MLIDLIKRDRVPVYKIMEKSVFMVVLLLTCLCLSLNSSGDLSSQQQSLHKYIPEANELGEWKKDGSPQEYKGEDLFLYIDGGAEIYHEYGFRQVVVQDYLNKGGKSISLEVFEMLNPESAYGMYTFKTSAQGDVLAIGDEALLEGYYMNFWKGNFLVTLTGFDEDEETVKGLLRIARAVDAKLETRGKKPHLISTLPERGLLALSIKYFKGNLGLYNMYPFFTKNVFAFGEGIKADYSAGYSVYIIGYRSIDDSQKRFSEVRKGFTESPRYNNFNPVDERLFSIKDRRGSLIFVSLFGEYILIINGAVNLNQTEEIFTGIRENIKTKYIVERIFFVTLSIFSLVERLILIPNNGDSILLTFASVLESTADTIDIAANIKTISILPIRIFFFIIYSS